MLSHAQSKDSREAWPNMALQRTRGLVAAQFLQFTGSGSAVNPLPPAAARR